MIVGTSALIRHELDGVVNMYSGIYHNPFLIWGRYRQEGSRFLLQISFQFHHVQMDGWKPARSSTACSGRSTIWGSKAAACIS